MRVAAGRHRLAGVRRQRDGGLRPRAASRVAQSSSGGRDIGGSGTSAPAAAPAVAGGRILFVDLARAIAVLLMVQGHTIDALLHPDFRTSLQYNAWLYLRGLTSCTFLFLSGAAFSLTAMRHWDEQRRFSRRAVKRIRRLAFFLALGYFVQFPDGQVRRTCSSPPTSAGGRSSPSTCCRTSR